MAGLLYYLPGKTRAISPKEVVAAGLDYAFERRRDTTGPRFTATPVRNGPDGKEGVVLADSPSVPRIGYFQDEQTWRQIPGTEAWVGMFANDRPKPDDLARREPLPGHPVVLGDGQTWIVPAARNASAVDGQVLFLEAIPRALDLDDDGKWIPGEPLERYRPLWEAVTKYLAVLTEVVADETDEAFRFEIDDQGPIDALAVNYRLGRAECVLLGLLTWGGPYFRLILEAVIDLPGFEAIKKKQDLDTESSELGRVDE